MTLEEFTRLKESIIGIATKATYTPEVETLEIKPTVDCPGTYEWFAGDFESDAYYTSPMVAFLDYLLSVPNE
jgi:hypothetical protein